MVKKLWVGVEIEDEQSDSEIHERGGNEQGPKSGHLFFYYFFLVGNGSVICMEERRTCFD